MAYRTTVTLPDDLGKRLEAVKSRFNVSRVCAEALAARVELEEIRVGLKESSDMGTIKQRLRKERAKFYEDCRSSGRNDGMAAAKMMSYEELRELSDDCDTYGSDLYEHFMPGIVRESSLWDNLEEELKEQRQESPSAFDEDEYLIGWLTGVLEFWNEVKEDL